jgi:hypothetical protein
MSVPSMVPCTRPLTLTASSTISFARPDTGMEDTTFEKADSPARAADPRPSNPGLFACVCVCVCVCVYVCMWGSVWLWMHNKLKLWPSTTALQDWPRPDFQYKQLVSRSFYRCTHVSRVTGIPATSFTCKVVSAFTFAWSIICTPSSYIYVSSQRQPQPHKCTHRTTL